MAITNAQQFKQLVNPPMKGKKRPGYRGEAAAASDRAGSRNAGRDTSPAGTGNVGDDFDRGSFQDAVRRGELKAEVERQEAEKREELVERFRNKQFQGSNFPGFIGMGLNLTGPLVQRGITANRNFFLDKVLGSKNFKDIDFLSLTPSQQEELYGDYMSARLSGEIDAFGNPLNQGDDSSPLLFPRSGIMDQAPEEKKEEDEDPVNLRLLAEGGRAGFQEGGGIEQRLEQLGGDVTSAEQMLQGINQRLKTAESSLGSGGGIGGLPGAGGPKIDEAFNPMQTPPGMFPAGPPQGFSSFEEMMKLKTPNLGQPNFYYDLEGVRRDPQGNLFTPKPGELPQTLSRPRPELENVFMGNMNPVGGPSDKLIPIDPYARTQLAGLSQDGQRFDSAQSAFDALAEYTRKAREINPGTRDMIGTELFQGAEGFKNFTNMFNQINDPNYVAPSLQLASQGSSGIPAVGFADGGNVVGGEYDFESARQAYGLGKLVKKITRSVKKIAKSPLGKLALGAAAFKFGPAFLSGQGFSLGTAKKFSDLKFLGEGANVNLFRAIGIPSILGGLMTKQDEDDQQQYAGADFPNPIDFYLSGQAPINTRLAAEGGLMRAGYQEGSKEPVAKKTMPLLDMGGMEKDYREEGGFVPIGRMEKADDVPARLSKNEFVFTADAVRNAGDGDVDLGAEKMYNMMKNLEAGGDVSEESQGLEGARKMFQTSQRLEEVL